MPDSLAAQCSSPHTNSGAHRDHHRRPVDGTLNRTRVTSVLYVRLSEGTPGLIPPVDTETPVLTTDYMLDQALRATRAIATRRRSLC